MKAYTILTPLQMAIYKDDEDNLYPELALSGLVREGYESLIILNSSTTMVKVDEDEFPRSGMDIYTLDGELLTVKTIKGLKYIPYYLLKSNTSDLMS